MRRRPRVDADTAPEALRRYDPADWGHDPARWYAARQAWQRQHPDADLDLPVNGPDVPWDRHAI